MGNLLEFWLARTFEVFKRPSDNLLDKKHLNIGILILNHNGQNWLPPLYESLRKNGYPNTKVYLVDNASTDTSVELTLERYPEVSVIRMPQNLGYCMAYNLAMPYAFADGCEWVIWANNDIRVGLGCLEKLASAAQSDPRIGVLGPAFLAWDSDEPNHYMVGNHPYAVTAMKSQSREPIDVEWVEGSFLMVSSRCIEAVGPLDPYLFFYWEETDFCRRARYQGWRVILEPSALVRHFAGGSSATDQQNKTTANRLRSRNYYIYQLANPFQSFTQNLKDGVHLFLVNLKVNRSSPSSSLYAEIQVFGHVLIDIRSIHKKWIRDRLGEHPPLTTKEAHTIRAEVIQG